MPLPRPLRDRHAIVALGLALAVALTVGFGVERFVGWGTVWSTAGEISAATWEAFVLLLALSYGARAVRLWRLLHDLDPRVRLARAAPVFFVHNALATFLPARLGEAAMPLLARRWLGIDWAATVGALAWWRLSDLAVVAALALSLLAAGASVLAPLFALALAACALPFVVFLLRGPLLRRVRGSGSTSPGRVRRLAARMLSGMPARLRSLTADLALALISWSTKLAGFAALLHGALAVRSADVPPLTLLAAAALAGDTAGGLPMPTLAGVGPFEAGILVGLTALGVDAARALAIGVLLHGALLASIAATGAIALAVGLLNDRRSGHAPRRI
jgi:uncharacterized membrane protein YbhN (UPF0104 family)